MASNNFTSNVPPVIVFGYEFSVWTQKLIAYLSLCRIPYSICTQPHMLPRPDLAELGVKYRRIPLMAVGKDIYCDTDFIMRKLSLLFPMQTSGIVSQIPEGKALEEMLCHWTDKTMFMTCVSCIPANNPSLFADENFIKDRTDFMGHDFNATTQKEANKQGYVVLKSAIEFLEQTLLSDGRKFLSGDTIALVDVHVGFTFDWARQFPGVYPSGWDEESGEHQIFWDWLNRYRSNISKAREEHTDGKSITRSQDAIQQILNSEYAEKLLPVQDNDITGLKKGDKIVGFPLKTGSSHKDAGILVGLTDKEAVIENDKGVRIHHPRASFKVEKEI